MTLRRTNLPILLLSALLYGCASHGSKHWDAGRAARIENSLVGRKINLSPELEDRILALDPRHVSHLDIQEVLSQAPAPRIIKIRGGINIRVIYPVFRRMNSFTEFLHGMGYPGSSLTNVEDGAVAYSCYEASDKLAGLIAWYYQREGLRPMIVGHSQGGMQAVKILHRIADRPAQPIHLWNPLTGKHEKTTDYTDPVTGEKHPITSLVLPYVSAVGAGGLTRVLPNQWEMNTKLRSIPDSVEDFTGFCKERDILGGDYLGYGSANLFKATGHAKVRNVWLPPEYSHGAMPETSHLLQSQAIKDWLDQYQPSPDSESRPKLDVKFEGNTKNILWAAEVWHSIKEHWVLELQRYIRARRAKAHDHG